MFLVIIRKMPTTLADVQLWQRHHECRRKYHLPAVVITKNERSRLAITFSTVSFYSRLFFVPGSVIVWGCNILDLISQMTEWVMRVSRPLAESLNDILMRQYFLLMITTHSQRGLNVTSDCFLTSNELISTAAAGKSSVRY